MSDELASNFTINDFPPEIIEMFLPDYEPTTISTLKLVSKRFYSIFNCDKFYKVYLLYSEEYYLADMAIESKSGIVKEVVDCIKQGGCGKWEGFLRLQKAHLENLRRGRFDCGDVIRVEGGRLKDWDEISDENNGRWLICLFCSGQITLINLATRQMLNYNLVFDYARILPGLVLLQLDYKFFIYKLINREGTCSLQLQHEICSRQDPHMEQSLNPVFESIAINGKSKSTFEERNVLVGRYKDNKGGIFHLWDLDSGAKSILSLGEQVNLCFDSFQFGKLYADQFPLVAVVYVHSQDHVNVLVVFDVETNRVTHFLNTGERNNSIHDVKCIHSNIILIAFSSGCALYRLSTNSQDVERIVPHFRFVKCHWQLMKVFKMDSFTSVIVWQVGDVTHMVRVGKSDFEQSSFSFPANHSVVGFIYPDIIFTKRKVSLVTNFPNRDSLFVSAIFSFLYMISVKVEARTLTWEHLFDLDIKHCDLNKLNTWHYPSRRVFLTKTAEQVCSFNVYYF